MEQQIKHANTVLQIATMSYSRQPVRKGFSELLILASRLLLFHVRQIACYIPGFKGSTNTRGYDHASSDTSYGTLLKCISQCGNPLCAISKCCISSVLSPDVYRTKVHTNTNLWAFDMLPACYAAKAPGTRMVNCHYTLAASLL